MQTQRDLLGLAIGEGVNQSDIEFFESHIEALRPYDFLVMNEAADLLPKELEIKRRLGSGHRGLVKLGTLIIKHELRRVFFVGKVNVECPEIQALLMHASRHGAELWFNEGVRQWLVYQTRKTTLQGQKSKNKNVGIPEGTVALIANTGEKERLCRIATQFEDVLEKFPKLVATSGTRAAITRALLASGSPRRSLNIELIGGVSEEEAHGPDGGDILGADAIYDTAAIYETEEMMALMERVEHTPSNPWWVLFFIDFKHRPEHFFEGILPLVRACTNPEQRVTLLLNSHMARTWGRWYLE